VKSLIGVDSSHFRETSRTTENPHFVINVAAEQLLIAIGQLVQTAMDFLHEP
jgi:hypothetical protein